MKPMTLTTMLYSYVHEEEVYNTMPVNDIRDDDDRLKEQLVCRASDE